MNKNIRSILFYITIVVSSFFLLTVLPDFRWQFSNDLQLKWEGLSSLGISSNLFNFAKGRGIYETTRLTYEAKGDGIDPQVLERLFIEDIQSVDQRLKVINQSLDIDYHSRIYTDQNKREFVFEFPSFITNPKLVTEDLLLKTNATIVVPDTTAAEDEDEDEKTGSIIEYFFPGYKEISSGLLINDIENFYVDNSSLFTVPVVRTAFKSAARDRLALAFARSQYDQNGNPVKPILLLVDGVPEFWAYHPDLYNSSNGQPFPTNVVWVPFGISDRVRLQTRASSIMGKSMNLEYKLASEQVIPASYASEGILLWVAASAIAVIMLAIYAWKKLGRASLPYYILGLGSFAVTLVSLSKLLARPITYLFLVTIILVVIAFGYYLANRMRDISEVGVNYAGLFTSVMLIFAALLVRQLPAPELLAAFDVLLLTGITWAITELIYLPGVISVHHENRNS